MYSVIRNKTYLPLLFIYQQQPPGKVQNRLKELKLFPLPAVLMKSFTVKTFTLTIVCVLLTFDFLFLNIMQWIFSWALRVHEKILTLSGCIWAFSVGFWICVFPSEASFNEIKLVSG